MARCKKNIELGGIDDALGKLISAQLALGKEALKLAGAGLNGVKGIKLPAGSSCCDIPEPCWMPLSLGEICCEICPSDTGEVCFVISNEDYRPHDYNVVAAGEHGALVSISQQQFILGSKERKVVSAKFKVPPRKDDKPGDSSSCCECNDYEVVIWVQGCRNHFLRWYINTSSAHKTCCHEVCVVDQPDYTLHWYDHFHVHQPCMGPLTIPKS